MTKTEGGYATTIEDVFVNCPYDEGYAVFFDVLLFTIIYVGFFPRCALERTDSTVGRLEKIVNIIGDTTIAVHDLSSERFNMPFELGLYLGCKSFGDSQQKQKLGLVVVADDKLRTVIISDLNGCDFANYAGDPFQLMRAVRDFLGGISVSPLPGIRYIRESYERYRLAMPSLCARMSLDESYLSYNDKVHVIKAWSQLDEARPKWIVTAISAH